MNSWRDDRGAFAALELTILTAIAIVMLLLVAGFGRVARGRELVDQAAAAAARAGSLSLTPAAAIDASRRAAVQTLHSGGLSCRATIVQLDVSQWRPGGQVTAHLTCHADLSSLTLAGLPGSLTLHADATSPLETYRPLPTALPTSGPR